MSSVIFFLLDTIVTGVGTITVAIGNGAGTVRTALRAAIVLIGMDTKSIAAR